MWNFDKIIPALIPGVIYRLAVIDLALIPGVTLCVFF